MSKYSREAGVDSAKEEQAIQIRSLISIFSVIACLSLMLCACGEQRSASLAPATPQPAKSVAIPVGAPQNQCPAAGMVRSVTMPPLAQKDQQNIIYTENNAFEGSDSSTTLNGGLGSGSIKRYDVKAHRQQYVITLAGSYIENTVISANGQWLLFVSDVGTIQSIQAKLQVVRMDGRYLQTIYCSTPGQDLGAGIENIQWSADQQQVIFKADVGDLQKILLLSIPEAQIRQEIVANAITSAFAPELWIDQTHVYLSSGPAGSSTFYLLDTTKGVNQPVSQLESITGQSIGRSYDGKQLFTSHYMLLQNDSCVASTGPSNIEIQGVVGGSHNTIYRNPTLAVIAIQAISDSRLLLALQNGTCDANANLDFSQNGLWAINKDGSGERRLTPPSVGSGGTLTQYSQELWSDISRDGSMYVWQTTRTLSSNPDAPTYNLMYGTIDGGMLVSFATAAHWTELALVGWTIL